MKRINSFFSVTLLAALMLSSCQDRDVFDSADHVQPSGEQVKLHFGLNIQGNFQSGLRAITATEERAIEQFDVLVFKDSTDGFVYSEHVEGVLRDTSVVVKTNYLDKQQLVVITNAGDEVRDIIDNVAFRGMPKDLLLSQLTFSLNDKKVDANGGWNASGISSYTKFPMWGESPPAFITKDSGAIPVKLLRMVARIDVVVDKQKVPSTTFEMDSVFLYNTNIGGRIVPDINLLKDGKATLPFDATLFGGRGSTAYIKYMPFKGDTSAIYTFETEAPPNKDANEATCLVIAGRFNNGSQIIPCYYRVDFLIHTDDPATDGKEHADILRNHCYKVTITSVAAEGYDTREKAFQGKSINIKADVEKWDSAPENVEVDGQYYLLVDTVKTLKFSRETSTIAITVETDYPQKNAPEWKVKSDKTWVSVPSGIQSGKELRFTVDPYATGDEQMEDGIYVRTATITVSAGRLNRTITIKQADVEAIQIVFYYDTGPAGNPQAVVPGKSIAAEWKPTTAKLMLWQAPFGKLYFMSSMFSSSFFKTWDSSSLGVTTINGKCTIPAMSSDIAAPYPPGDSGIEIIGQVSNGFQEKKESIVLKVTTP